MNHHKKPIIILFCFSFLFAVSGLNAQVDPDTAEKASIDRFSTEAGILFVRDTTNNFPGPNEPIDCDREPFITHGFGPGGELISYYNFDVQPTEPAPIYVLIRDGESNPVESQLNIVDVIPGDSGYNDFWQVFMVTVPANYTANTITSFNEIIDSGYSMQKTDIIVNCPIVPEGSTAELRYTEESPDLVRGWYKGMVVFYFNFSEKTLMATEQDMVPLSPIYVTFNINPDQPGGGPPSGFRTDTTGRAHNVVSTLPGDDDYSPLWSVNIYDNMDFEDVSDLASVLSANILVMNAAIVNCPIVSAETATGVERGGSAVPENYSLDQNYPNPFNPATIIKFSVPKDEHVSLKIYNSIGEEIAEIVNEVLPGGSYSVEWEADNLSSGIYYYTLSSGNFKETKKMMLLR